MTPLGMHGPLDAADEEAEEAAADPATPDDIQAERARITKENQRKIDERNDKLKKAQQKVAELNYRFADWYYVISEDVYKKIHLGRADIIKESEEAKESGSGLDAFRGLETQGVEGAEAATGDEAAMPEFTPPN